MAFLEFNNVKISAVCACVPKNISKNAELTELMSEDEIEKMVKSIGIHEKRFVDDHVTSSDLCFHAAEDLIQTLSIDRESVDVLIFLSQTPDYITPATAPILQDRLGLSQNTACFDINLACSGYVYALSTAFLYASQPHVNRVLLLNGETFSKIVSKRDKVNYPLYGDAGTATLVEKSHKNSKSFFSLNSDGSGKDSVIVPAGGFRNPSSKETLQENEKEDGNFRNDHQVFMNGVDVFNFTMMRVPKAIKDLLKKTEMKLDEVDQIVFHQANKFMTDFFVKKLKFDLDKTPYCLGKYGNTSSCSVPLTLASEFSSEHARKNVVLSGFGGGLSWATALLNMEECSTYKVQEI